MRKMNISKCLVGIAILLASPLLVSAQQVETHIGKVTGHAERRQTALFSLLLGLPWLPR